MEGYIGYGMPSLGAITSMLEINRKKRLREEAGITYIDGFQGIERIGIPHKYEHIEIGGKYFTCTLDDRKTVYTADGEFLFECTDFKYYKEGMFLVGNKKEVRIIGKDSDEFGYALYNQGDKLTEAIFKPYWISERFNESGFAVVHIFGQLMASAIINKLGEVVFKASSLRSAYLNGVICSHDNKIINLLTGNVICKDGYGAGMKTDEFMFVQVDSNCIYQINKDNGEFIVHGVEKIVEEPIKFERHIKKGDEPKPKKQSRNEQCACGSGKKFKNCCINK